MLLEYAEEKFKQKSRASGMIGCMVSKSISTSRLSWPEDLMRPWDPENDENRAMPLTFMTYKMSKNYFFLYLKTLGFINFSRLSYASVDFTILFARVGYGTPKMLCRGVFFEELNRWNSIKNLLGSVTLFGAHVLMQADRRFCYQLVPWLRHPALGYLWRQCWLKILRS